MQIGQDAEDRLAGASFEPAQAAVEEADVAAKAVDDEALDTRLLGPGEQVERAAEVGEDATAVDVGDQDHRTVDRFGEAHVGDVAIAQVDFRRAAGTLDQQALVLPAQALPGSENGLHRQRLVGVVVACVEVAQRLAVNDHLRPPVGRWLQQHRVEVGVCRHPGGERLQRLRAADLAAIDGHRRVERHVLWLEGCDADAAAVQDAAEGRHQDALAGVGSASLHHQAGGSLLVHAGSSGWTSRLSHVRDANLC
ncbi:MAG: hypothetical protein AW12_00505 [Candidatus Accumulibacter sp. BA-94]|nr:MAG: hypothetical protein AW12_00505 [Candidatus Accumulibacter sp. BA-94]